MVDLFVQENPIPNPLGHGDEPDQVTLMDYELLGTPDEPTVSVITLQDIFSWLCIYGGSILGISFIGLVIWMLIGTFQLRDKYGRDVTDYKIVSDKEAVDYSLTLPGNIDIVMALAVTPDGRYLLTGGRHHDAPARPQRKVQRMNGGEKTSSEETHESEEEDVWEKFRKGREGANSSDEEAIRFEEEVSPRTQAEIKQREEEKRLERMKKYGVEEPAAAPTLKIQGPKLAPTAAEESMSDDMSDDVESSSDVNTESTEEISGDQSSRNTQDAVSEDATLYRAQSEVSEYDEIGTLMDELSQELLSSDPNRKMVPGHTLSSSSSDREDGEIDTAYKEIMINSGLAVPAEAPRNSVFRSYLPQWRAHIREGISDLFPPMVFCERRGKNIATVMSPPEKIHVYNTSERSSIFKDEWDMLSKSEDGEESVPESLILDTAQLETPPVPKDFLSLPSGGKHAQGLTLKEQLAKKTSEKNKNQSPTVDPDVLITLGGDMNFSGSPLSPYEKLLKQEEKIREEKEKNAWLCPLTIWDLETHNMIAVKWEHEAPITSISVSPVGDVAVSTDESGVAIFWNVPEWTVMKVLGPEERTAQGLGRITTLRASTFTSSGRQVILAGRAKLLDNRKSESGEIGAVILWDLSTWKEITRKHPVTNQTDTFFQTHFPVGEFDSLTLVREGKYLIAGASRFNAGAYWFDVHGQGFCMVDLNEPSRKSRSVTSGARSNVFSGTSGHESPYPNFLAVTASHEGDRVVSCDNIGRINLWNFSPSYVRKDRGVYLITQMDAVDALGKTLRQVLFSHDRRYVAFVGEETFFRNGRSRTLEMLGSLNLEPMDTLHRTTFQVESIIFSPDDKYFFAGCDDGCVRCWKVNEIPVMQRKDLSEEIIIKEDKEIESMKGFMKGWKDDFSGYSTTGSEENYEMESSLEVNPETSEKTLEPLNPIRKRLLERTKRKN